MIKKQKICALIITLNEESNIKRCINSLDFVQEIIILDSYSKDKTADISKKLGATVHFRKFDNYAAQRNFGLSLVNPKYEWVLMIDADELITHKLKDEILEKTSFENKVSMYMVRRKDFFLNKWLKYSSGYPTWFPRLFRNNSVSVVREINERYETKGIIDKLINHIHHYPFNKGIDHWFEKHNLYSKMEAEKMKTEINSRIPYKYIFSSDPIKKRIFYKSFIYKLPFRPYIVFFLLYILRGGFLDGKAGYIYCKMKMIYEHMISIKYHSAK